MKKPKKPERMTTTYIAPVSDGDTLEQVLRDLSTQTILPKNYAEVMFEFDYGYDSDFDRVNLTYQFRESDEDFAKRKASYAKAMKSYKLWLEKQPPKPPKPISTSERKRLEKELETIKKRLGQ